MNYPMYTYVLKLSQLPSLIHGSNYGSIIITYLQFAIQVVIVD